MFPGHRFDCTKDNHIKSMFMAATSSDEEDRQVVTALVKKLAISRKSLQHLKNRFAYTMHITITTALRHKRVCVYMNQLS
jgi:uncharacterized protein (UPF0210 family)